MQPRLTTNQLLPSEADLKSVLVLLLGCLFQVLLLLFRFSNSMHLLGHQEKKNNNF